MIFLIIRRSRALPQKLFGGYIGIVVLVVCNLKDELIDFDEIIVHDGVCFFASINIVAVISVFSVITFLKVGRDTRSVGTKLCRVWRD
ncbi:MAG TPA: hypothetical protein VEB88_02955 [Candidatus Acidoferrales bacterium]|nr:hypothetical protein [Candidatus Acidoferrales bacterium]